MQCVIRLSIASLLGLITSGCASPIPDYAPLFAEGQAKQAPVLIYDTTWNDPNVDKTAPGLAIWLLDIQGDTVKSIKLKLAECGFKGTEDPFASISFLGPFTVGDAYIATLKWHGDATKYRDTWRAHSPEFHFSAHLVIQSIEITYADGRHDLYDRTDMTRLLSRRIANYCLLSPSIPHEHG